MRTPIIHIVAPLTGKIGNFRISIRITPGLPIKRRMGEKYREIFFATRSAVATRITIRVRIFLIDQFTGLLGKIIRIPSFIQDRFPQPDTSMITVTAYQITYITIYTLCKFRGIIPELPARSIDYYKQTEFIACIHESRVLRTMGIADHLHSRIPQFLCVTPVNAVGYCITYYSKVLVAIGTDQRFFIRSAVQPETILTFKFHTADTNTATVTIHHFSFVVADTYNQII